MTLPELLITVSSSALGMKLVEYGYSIFTDWLKGNRDNKAKLNLSAADQLAKIQAESNKWAKELLKAKEVLKDQIAVLKVEVAILKERNDVLKQENERLKNADQ